MWGGSSWRLKTRAASGHNLPLPIDSVVSLACMPIPVSLRYFLAYSLCIAVSLLCVHRCYCMSTVTKKKSNAGRPKKRKCGQCSNCLSGKRRLVCTDGGRATASSHAEITPPDRQRAAPERYDGNMKDNISTLRRVSQKRSDHVRSLTGRSPVFDPPKRPTNFNERVAHIMEQLLLLDDALQPEVLFLRTHLVPALGSTGPSSSTSACTLPKPTLGPPEAHAHFDLEISTDRGKPTTSTKVQPNAFSILMGGASSNSKGITGTLPHKARRTVIPQLYTVPLPLWAVAFF